MNTSKYCQNDQIYRSSTYRSIEGCRCIAGLPNVSTPGKLLHHFSKMHWSGIILPQCIFSKWKYRLFHNRGLRLSAAFMKWQLDGTETVVEFYGSLSNLYMTCNFNAPPKSRVPFEDRCDSSIIWCPIRLLFSIIQLLVLLSDSWWGHFRDLPFGIDNARALILEQLECVAKCSANAFPPLQV